MIKIAVYGKGGIGKSTTVSNLAAALSEKGLRVMQIGCDPKADSTTLLTHGVKMQTALGLMRERNNDFALSDMAKEGFGGVICVEAGGPTPGLGCAGRGIIAALEKLEEKGAYETFRRLRISPPSEAYPRPRKFSTAIAILAAACSAIFSPEVTMKTRSA